MSCCVFGSIEFIQNRGIVIIVVYNLFYNVAFKLFVRLTQMVCVHSIDHGMYRGILMSRWVARVVWYNGNSHGSFTVYVEGEALCTFLHCDVQEIDGVVYFFLHGKFHCGCCVTERFEDFVYVGGGIIVYC